MQNETGRYASVRVEGENNLVIVPISFKKPDIPTAVQQKWQKIVDLVAGIIQVPSGLITRLTEENLEIVAASTTKGNPYKGGDHDSLGIGMFCETVAGKRQNLLVDDTFTTAYWAGNPHAGFGMRTYMGVPIKWEDGELFGTFCMLSDKASSLESSFLDLMQQFKEIIETDLRYTLLQKELEERLSVKQLEIREMHHRLKNQFILLIGYIDLQVFGTAENGVKDALKEVQNRIQAVSLIHEELYKSSTGRAPSLDVYLPRLCGYILENLMKGGIAVEYAIESISLQMEQEIAIAMIVSELFTNSAKHAFPGGISGSTTGKISLQVKGETDSSLSLVYRDNGIGLPATFNQGESKSLGLTLLNALTIQLNGTMETENEGGAKFSFIFHP